MLITHDSDEGVVTTAYDRETAEPLVSGMSGEVVTALSTTGRLVGADAAGDITEFDVETLTPIASLPGARSMPSTLQFDDGGSYMLVTAPDQTVQVYDSVSRTRIGDAIPSSAPEGTVEAWLGRTAKRWRSTAPSASWSGTSTPTPWPPRRASWPGAT